MSCCGKKRANLGLQRNPSRESPGRESLGRKPSSASQALGGSLVEYIGLAQLTIRGPVSGNVYRFARSGARMFVDGRDVAYLLAIPELRKKT